MESAFHGSSFVMDVQIVPMPLMKSAHSTPGRIKHAQNNLSFAKEVVDVSAEQLFVMAEDSVHMAKMN